MDAARRSGEATLLGDRDEVLEPSQFHGCPLGRRFDDAGLFVNQITVVIYFRWTE
jgi:hypothetical protein